MGIDVANDPKTILEIMSTMEIIKAMIYRAIGEDSSFSNCIREDVGRPRILDHEDLLGHIPRGYV